MDNIVLASYRRDVPPREIRSPEAMRRFIDAVASEVDRRNEVLVMVHRARPLTPQGFADHEFSVVIDSQDKSKGALSFSQIDSMANSIGSKPSRPSHDDIVVFWRTGEAFEMDADCMVTIIQVKAAAVEFLESGGARPTAVEWQEVL